MASTAPKSARTVEGYTARRVAAVTQELLARCAAPPAMRGCIPVPLEIQAARRLHRARSNGAGTKRRQAMSEMLGFVLTFLGIAITYVLLPTAWIEMEEHRGHRPLECPHAKCTAFVQTDAKRGAAACMGLPVKLDVLACSMWPDRAGCDRGCLSK
jgi:hypothetical protein